MTLSKIGQVVLALVATAALGLGMTACGSGPIGYMWVLGHVNPNNSSGLITGFTIDNYTGNLTAVPHSPFPSAGTNPVTMLVKPGGRFVFVINQGSGATGTPGTSSFVSSGSGIAVFSVGGGGILTFEQTYFSQGTQPVWAALDGSGTFLYVVDKYEPTYDGVTHVNGSITAFSIAGDTGRLTLVPNQSILTNQIPQSWFEVGPNPVMSKVGSGSCLFTLSPNEVYPYAVNSSNGQLTTVTTGPYLVTGSTNLTSINTSTGSSAASYTYLTDYVPNQPGNIFSLQAGGTACSLTPVAGGAQTNLSGTTQPVNSLTSTSGKFLYVLNYMSTGTVTNSNSTISAFTINTQGQLAPLSDTNNNPYAVGSGPKCIVQDPSNQYMYIADFVDGTITGKILDQNRGYLSDLSRGSVFTVASNPNCLAISGNL